MSKFTTPAILEMLEHYRCRVYEPFEFYLGFYAATAEISGITDFLSNQGV